MSIFMLRYTQLCLINVLNQYKMRMVHNAISILKNSKLWTFYGILPLSYFFLSSGAWKSPWSDLSKCYAFSTALQCEIFFSFWELEGASWVIDWWGVPWTHWCKHHATTDGCARSFTKPSIFSSLTHTIYSSHDAFLHPLSLSFHF